MKIMLNKFLKDTQKGKKYFYSFKDAWQDTQSKRWN